MKVWICAIAKMEELYIKEWIDWHNYLGVDHIIIGDNNDSNYEFPLKPIIQDYIDQGYVEVINLNDKLGCQNQFYNEVYQKYKNNFDWIGFIDIDEFIELPAYNNLHHFLSDNKFNNYDSIILPWLNFNDNNNIYYEDKPVRLRFTTAIIGQKTGIKYFIRSLNNLSRIISRHNPGRCQCLNNYKIKYCDSLGQTNIIPIYKKEENQEERFTQIKVNMDIYHQAYIGHYITKSTEEYIKYKILRGRGAGKVGNYKIRYNKNFYFRFNLYNIQKQQLFDEYSEKIQNELIQRLKKYKTDINGQNQI